MQRKVKQIIADMESYEEKISQSESIAQLCGYEGMFSKLYFEGFQRWSVKISALAEEASDRQRPS